MTRSRFLTLFGITGCAAAAVDRTHAEGAEEAEVKLTHPLAEEAAKNPAGGTTRLLGIVFPEVVEAALTGTDRGKKLAAIGLLLWIGEHASLDTSSSEGYGFLLFKAAKIIGDEDLNAAARKHGPRSFANIRMYMLFEFGDDNDAKKAAADFKKHFPKFAKFVASNQGEQGAAGNR